MANGLARTSKMDFMSYFDSGSPINQEEGEVIIMYNTKSSLPHVKTKEVMGDTGDGIVSLSLSESIQNCDMMHVATIPIKNERVCTAIVQDYENWHTRRWARKDGTVGSNGEVAFRPINRGQTDRGRTFRVPTEKQMKKHWEALLEYFKNFEDVLAELKPIAEKVAIDNTVIVMTCNIGQSELLMNFVCNARAKGLNIDNVLVFPTDEETKDLAEGLGLATFFDKRVSKIVIFSLIASHSQECRRYIPRTTENNHA